MGKRRLTRHGSGLRCCLVGALVGAAGALGMPLLAGAPRSGTAPAGAASVVAVPDKCATSNPVMPPSTGTETPAGFSIQMPGAVLAPGTDANTLAEAYYEWNDMKCTEYTHHYRWQPPDYYYYDCVGFTGYTTSVADPTAWSSVRQTLHIGRRLWRRPRPSPSKGSSTTWPPRRSPDGRPSPMWRPSSQGDILRLAAHPARRSARHQRRRALRHAPRRAPQPIGGSGGSRWEVCRHGLDRRRPRPRRLAQDPHCLRHAQPALGAQRPDLDPFG